MLIMISQSAQHSLKIHDETDKLLYTAAFNNSKNVDFTEISPNLKSTTSRFDSGNYVK